MEEEDMDFRLRGFRVPGNAEPERVASQSANPDWVRRYLADSIYLWACGEKAEDQGADCELSDRVIGWVILIVQGLAYTTLAMRADRSPDSDLGSHDQNGDGAGYSLASVAGAMYLLVASTTPDLRAGFSLLVDGVRVDHRLFGASLLTVHAFMLGAAMKVLLSSANDDTSVVMNAVAVLFIADLDEKALGFFLTVPQKWRFFWAIQSIAMGFALALVAIEYAGDFSKLSKNGDFKLDNVPSWFIWVVNPGAVTLLSFTLSLGLQAFSDACREASKPVGTLTWGIVGETMSAQGSAGMTRAKERLQLEPFFFAVLILWLVDGVVSWWCLIFWFWVPVAVDFPLSSDEEDGYVGLKMTENIVAFIFSNLAFASGLALMVIRVFMPKNGWVFLFPETHEPVPDKSVGTEISVATKDSRVPSLLVGWGIGYWVTSLLYLLGGSWLEGGWQNAPTEVTVVAYVVLPCFFLVAVFLVADMNFLGTTFGAFIKPSVDVFRNRRTVWYWILATVIRDVLLMWMIVWFALRHYLTIF